VTEHEQAVDLKGIAAVLNVSVDTARRKAKTGDIPSFRVGSLYRFFPSAVVAHLSEPVDEWAMSSASKNSRRAA
jgi:excisionase family DNA binding protein